MTNRDLGKKENVERQRPGEKLTRRDLAIERVLVVHSNDNDDAPNREVHEAYSDENIERLQENASPASEGEEFAHDVKRVKKDGSSGQDGAA